MASNIFITGAGGFIGSHVVEALLEAGHRVRALVRYGSLGSHGYLDSSPAAIEGVGAGRLEIVAGDVCDPHFVLGASEGSDVLVHLAALIGIPYSYDAPGSYQAVNVGGTLNILEAARRHKVRRVIVTSTSEVYGTAQYTPIDERHPLTAQSPYAASKIGADKLAESYFRSFGTPVVTLRPFNTYGPRQSPRAIVPTVLAQALAGAKTINLGNLTPKRDVVYVEDTARAFAMAVEAPNIEGLTIHFGSGTAHSIETLARACLAAAGSDAQIVRDAERVRAASSEINELVCDATLARTRLGWEPRVSLEAGLQRTAEWLKLSPPLRALEYRR